MTLPKLQPWLIGCESWLGASQTHGKQSRVQSSVAWANDEVSVISSPFGMSSGGVMDHHNQIFEHHCRYRRHGEQELQETIIHLTLHCAMGPVCGPTSDQMDGFSASEIPSFAATLWPPPCRLDCPLAGPRAPTTAPARA